MSNVFSKASSDSSSAGYFRLGFVVLDIPPEQISTSHVSNTERIQTLRGMNEMFKETGKSRWDVTVSWIAMLTEGDLETRYKQWIDLQNVLAIFKCAPFVEVESPHLRQILANVASEKDAAPLLPPTQRIAMALRQLQVSTHPDILDALNVTLTMTYFNFGPYSVAFDYQGTTLGANGVASPAPVSADQSDIFKNYVTTWAGSNLFHGLNQLGDPVAPFWMQQSPGEVNFTWHNYMPVTSGQTPGLPAKQGSTAAAPASNSSALAASSASSSTSAGETIDNTPSLRQLIIDTATRYGVQPNVALAQCYTESSGKVGTASSSKGAQGLWQMEPATAAHYGCTNPTDPTSSTDAAMHYMHDLLGQFGGSYDSALAAYNAGPQVVTDYKTGASKGLTTKGTPINPKGLVTAGGVPPYTETLNYIAKIKNLAAGKYADAANPATASQTPAVAASVAQASGTASPTTFVTVTKKPDESAFQAVLQSFFNAGWSMDHRSDLSGIGTALIYKDDRLRLAPAGAVGATAADPTLFPTQVSVTFVNNLAQMPMASYQYPTYQHLGPCSSMITMSFTSVGTVSSPSAEPVHSGMARLAGISHALRQQYLQMRNQVRVPSSTHRMQAVFVENQVLNLLGIFGMLIDEVSTETMKESSNLGVAQLSGFQYENVFEEIQPYKVNGITQSYARGIQTLLNSGDLKSAASNVSGPIQPLIDYQAAMNSGNEDVLNGYLSTAAKMPGSPLFSYMSGATLFTPPAGPALALITQMVSPQVVSSYPTAAARAAFLQSSQSNQWTIADYLMFKQIAYATYSHSMPSSVNIPGSPATGTPVGLSLADVTAAEQSIDSVLATNNPTRGALTKEAYSLLFPYFAQVDLTLRSACNQIMNSPLGDTIKKTVSTSDPSLMYNDHGAYRDMGIKDLLLNGADFNPGMYFFDDKKVYWDAASKAYKTIAQSIQGAQSETTQSINTGQMSDSTAPVTNNLTGTIPLSPTASIPGDENSLKRMTNIPGYSMREAFPTFKLFFLEDANEGIYYSFDNFYSYASVLDIEMIRPLYKPATLRIQMTNMAHLFNHKVYDGSSAGRWEKVLNRFAIDDPNAPTATPAGMETAVTAQRNGLNSAPTMGADMTEKKRVPLQYFPLQPGSKIQLRMGYSNNPDDLFPVFCGVVTEIEGTEVLTITAESFLAELFNNVGDDSKTNSWFHLGNIPFWQGKGPAYGGVQVLGSAGDAQTVLSRLLQTSGAKHFGHWQIDTTIQTNLMQGFGWKELAADVTSHVASGIGADNVSVAMANHNDRTAENISIFEAVNYNGIKVNTDNAHSYLDEGSSLFGLHEYWIDTNTKMTTYELMRDVARRWPHFKLLEKWYGFPYSCDATMVFGHPLDWYHARPAMLGDQAAEAAALKNTDAYKRWWAASGRSAVIALVGDNPDVLVAAASPAGLYAVLDSFVNSNLTILPPDHEFSGSVSDRLANAANGMAAAVNGLAGAAAWIFEATNAFQTGDSKRIRQGLAEKVRLSYLQSLQGSEVVPASAVKPVRRYHLIDHQTIMHNGMTLNREFHNCVKIGANGSAKNYVANGGISRADLRILDVSDQINDPQRNVMDMTHFSGGGVEMAYAQSFLLDEIASMYEGDLILRGTPEIEPGDVLLLLDPSTAMSGAVEAGTVMQIMNQEMGWITIVQPRLVACANEAASVELIRLLSQMMSYAVVEANRFGTLPSTVMALAPIGALTGTGIIIGAVPAAVAAGSAAFTGALTVAADVGGAVAAGEGILGTTAAAVSTAAGSTVAAGIATVVAVSPLGWFCLAAGILGAAGFAVWTLTNGVTQKNPLVISPVMRFGRPWVGGIEGWSFNDMIATITQNYYQFMNDEVYPTLDAWSAISGNRGPVPSVFQPTPQALAGK